jgi:hypothetical protein
MRARLPLHQRAAGRLRSRVSTGAKLAVPVVGVLLVLAIAWFASEVHYENCVDAAKARHPIRSTAGGSGDSGTGFGGEGFGGRNFANPREEFDQYTGKTQTRRRRAVDGCSQLPW